MALHSDSYPASLKIDYPKKLNRLTTFFRIFMIVPILVILALLTGGGGYSGMQADSPSATNSSVMTTEELKEDIKSDFTQDFESTGLGIAGGLFFATLLMILFRQRYPRWWFDFNLELQRFSMRIGAYALLLTDKYPSTEDTQTVHLDLKYPNAEKDLKRWMPLVKWFLAIPHYIILVFLFLAVGFAVIIAWFAILITGKYPEGLFNFVVGVMRWNFRVNAYAIFLTTDRYPAFSLD